MLRGLWQLTWLEIKIFVREPLGVFGTRRRPGAAVHRDRAGCVGAADAPRRAAAAARRVGRPADLRGDAHRDQRGAVARHDHRDLPRGRHPQAAARDAAAAAHHPDRARAGEAAASPRSRWRRWSLAGRRYFPATPACRCCRSALALLFSTRQHPVARLPDRQRRADGALRAAARRAGPLSDARRCRACSCRSRRCRPACRLVARVLPLTYAVSLLRGIWRGDGWLPHLRRRRRAGARPSSLLTAVPAGCFGWE